MSQDIVATTTQTGAESSSPSKPWGMMPKVSAAPVAGAKTVPIPIPGAIWPSLTACFPLSEDAWEAMLSVLNAMKPGLVMPKEDESAKVARLRDEAMGHKLKLGSV